MQVDVGDGKDGVLADVGMAMLEAGSCGREEGLDQFRFAELAEEAKSVAADVLVGMLQVVSDAVAGSSWC